MDRPSTSNNCYSSKSPEVDSSNSSSRSHSQSSADSGSSTNSNKRKRRATLDENETKILHPAKKTQLSPSNSDTASQTSSEVLIDVIASGSDSQSTYCGCPPSVHGQYELCTLNSPISPEDTGTPSSSCSNISQWPTRGDITPHGNRRGRKNFNEREESCPTPTDIRLCPLPALKWANASDVWNVMCRKDLRATSARDPTMLDHHPGLQPRMRAILLDWLIEVCEVYKLHRETYYLAVDYLDRYLSGNRNVQKTHLQLIGITCLFLAAKVEEIYPPKIGEFAYVTDGACTEEEILQNELLLLQGLEWSISPVTIMGWLGVYMQLNVSNRTPSSFFKKDTKHEKFESPETDNSNSSVFNVNSKCSISNNLLSDDNSTSKSSSNNNFKQDRLSSKNSSNNGNLRDSDIKIEKSKASSSKYSKSTSVSSSDQQKVLNDDDIIMEEPDDAFIYPQFSGMQFAQTAQLIDLCSLDLGLADFPYSVIAAAAISHTFNRETATRVSGYDWNVIEACATWMQPFFQTICDDPQHLFLLEHNEPVKTNYGLGHICPNIVTDDSHIIQTHSISMDMFDKALFKREQYVMTKIHQEASPAVALLCPDGLLTPPSSSRKPLDGDQLLDIESEIQVTKTS